MAAEPSLAPPQNCAGPAETAIVVSPPMRRKILAAEFSEPDQKTREPSSEIAPPTLFERPSLKAPDAVPAEHARAAVLSPGRTHTVRNFPLP